MSNKTIILCMAVVCLIAATLFLPPLQGAIGRSAPARGPAVMAIKSIPKSALETKVLSTIDAMDKDLGTKYENIPYIDGKCLRLLAETAGAKNVAEVSSSTGYSSLWLAMAVAPTSGKVTTYNGNDDMASMAGKYIKDAGVSDIVTVETGDPHKSIKLIKGTLDVAFIDADKDGYVDYLNTLMPLVRPGGLIIAHNVSARDSSMASYVKAVTTNPDLETVFFEQGAGMSITLKKRAASEVAGSSEVKDKDKILGELKYIREPDILWVPTPQDVVDKMLELVAPKKDDILYDLGCGDGRIVVTAAKRYGCKAWGFDIDPRRVKDSIENVEKNGVANLVTIEQKDVFTLDLSKANCITLYLLPSLNAKLIPQLDKCKPGTRIVSHDFDMRGAKPEKVIDFTDSDGSSHTIYYWTTPLNKVNE